MSGYLTCERYCRTMLVLNNYFVELTWFEKNVVILTTLNPL